MAGMANEKRVIFYQDAAGKEPFNDWLRIVDLITFPFFVGVES